jgi:hypothetical protein
VIFDTKSLNSTGGATSDSYTPLAAGDYYFKAVYSGDSNYLGSESNPADEHLVVEKAGTTTVTYLSATTITLGGSVTDQVIVTGLGGVFPYPSGTVTFYVNGVIFDTKSLNSTGGATSDSYTPLAAGDYYFKAVYSGDSNYLGSESNPADEHLVVEKAGTTTVTYLSATTITLGGSVTDQVIVTGLGGVFPYPSGTVTFYVNGVIFDTKSLNSTGGATSDSYTPLAAGDYYFKAVYSGDSNYLGSESNPADEHLVVEKAGTTTVTYLSATTITLGGSVTDQVIVTGLGGVFPYPSGTVTFYVNGVIFDTKSLNSTGGATSDSYTPLAAGDYYFKAVYSGDSNYLGSESNPADEHLVVEKAGTTTVTYLSATTITLGGSVTDQVIVTGLGGVFPYPSGTVTFYVNGVIFDTKSLNSTGGATSDSYTPLAAGDYYFKAVYSGDSNYLGSESNPADEHLVVVIPVTRTQGFWATHTAFTEYVFDTYLGGRIVIGASGPHQKVIDNYGKLFGGFWASISRSSSGAKRPAIDQARMILLQQLLAAILNHAAFGTPVPIDPVTHLDLISAANQTYSSNNRAEMLRLANLLDAYNESGDTYPIPPWLPSPGPATPRESRKIANILFWNSPL